MKSDFEGLLDRYFEKVLEDVPSFAVTYGGLASGEGKLEQWNPQFLENRESARQTALESIEQLNENAGLVGRAVYSRGAADVGAAAGAGPLRLPAPDVRGSGAG